MSAEQIAAERDARMRARAQANKVLRESASLVELDGQQPYRNESGEGTYRESRTARLLRELYEEDDDGHE